MSKLLAYIGGVRSGKSEAAEARVARFAAGKRLKVAYLGTVDESQGDRELGARVKAHRRRRPEDWATFAVGAELDGAAEQALGLGYGVLLVDGLGLWAAQRLADGEAAALSSLGAALARLRGAKLAVLVLDEVGLGGVSGHPAARAFADLNGRLNQAVAAEADEVWSVQAGVETRLK